MPNRILLCACAAGVLMAWPSRSVAEFPLHDLRASSMTMRGHYDEEKTDASYTITRETCDGKPCIRAVWSSRVKKIDMWLWPDSRPIRTRFEKPRKGILVEIEYKSGGATYRYTEKGKTTTTRIEQANLLETLAIDVIFLGYPFEQGGEKVFHGIDADSDDGDTYKFYVELDEVLDISVGGKKVKAYKLEFSVKGFTGLFAPTFYFYYSHAKPHRYLKYEGPDEEFVLTGGELAL